MNIYLIERVGEIDWDEFYGFVVCADSVQSAEQVTFDKYDPDYEYSGWTREVKTTLIGEAKDDEPKIIQKSYQAS